MQKTYRFETYDIVIPLVSALDNSHVDESPHPLKILQAIVRHAGDVYTGNVIGIPIIPIADILTTYRGSPEYNSILDLSVKLWSRCIFYMEPINIDVGNSFAQITSISAGDISVTFNRPSKENTDEHFNM